MLTASAAQLNVIGKSSHSTLARLKINRGGTWVDMTDLEGRNWVRDITVKDDVDAPVATMKAVLEQAQFYLNLSPLVDASKLNAAGTLMDINRQVIIEIATVPIDTMPSASDWNEVFRGVIHTVDFGKNTINVDARDQGGKLQDLWIETQKVYGSATGVRVELVMQDILDDNNADLDVVSANWTWNGTTTVSASDTSEVLVGDYIGYQNAPLFEVTAIVPSTSITIANPNALTIPTGSGPGSSIIIPDAYRVTLYTENGTASDPLYYNGGGWDDSPDWAVKSFKQARKRVLTALQDLATQIGGWRVKYRWQANLGAFALMLYEPDRSKTTPDHTFSEDRINSIGRLSLSLADIRNKVRVTYGVADDRTSVYKEDTASITKYGLRAMDIAESSTSQIDSSTEANALAQAAVDDLSEPTAIAAFSMPLFWPAQVEDLYRWEANSRYFDTDQDLAVTGFQHTMSSRKGNFTTINVRGKPSGGTKRWLGLETLPGLAESVDSLSDNAADNVSASDSVNGIVVTYDDPRTMDPPIMDWAFTRCYADTSSSFTPSASNLRGIGRQTRFEITGLIPGTVYYTKLEIIDADGNVSTISGEVTATALKVGPYHENNDGQRDQLVRNPNLGIFTRGYSVVPDFWDMYTGTWGTEGTRVGSIAGSTGGSVVRLYSSAGGSPAIACETIPYPGGDIIDFGFRVRGNGDACTVVMRVDQLNAAGSSIANDTLSMSVAADTDWYESQVASIQTDSACVALTARVTATLDAGEDVYVDRAWVGRGYAYLDAVLEAGSDKILMVTTSYSMPMIEFTKNIVGMTEIEELEASGTTESGSDDDTLNGTGAFPFATSNAYVVPGDRALNTTNSTDVDVVTVDQAYLDTEAGGNWGPSGKSYEVYGRHRQYQIDLGGHYIISIGLLVINNVGDSPDVRVSVERDDGGGFEEIAATGGHCVVGDTWSVPAVYLQINQIEHFDAGDIIKIVMSSQSSGESAWIAEGTWGGFDFGESFVRIRQITRVA